MLRTAPHGVQPNKRRKIDATSSTTVASDALDPVEKLLSFASRDDDFLNNESSSEEDEHMEAPSRPNPHIQLMLDENLKQYYLQRHPKNSDTSSFSSLNGKPARSHSYHHNSHNGRSASAAPFFRAVNFNPKPASAYSFDEYLSYDELAEDDVSPSQLPVMAPLKMSFHYRHHDNLNLSHTSQPEAWDVLKALNKRCILDGSASEMVSTGNLLINDFFM
jgi:hypothetical protein